MSSSYTLSESKSFTIIHAKQLGSKVASDLKRIQRFYNEPSDERIEAFEQEIVELLKNGFLKEVIYGFKRDSKWISPTLFYTANELSNGNDDDPGKITPNENVFGATFYSFLTYSSNWFQLTPEKRSEFERTLKISRSDADKPQINGYLVSDKSYSSGGVTLDRKIVKNL